MQQQTPNKTQQIRGMTVTVEEKRYGVEYGGMDSDIKHSYFDGVADSVGFSEEIDSPN